MDLFGKGQAVMLASDLLLRELAEAPAEVQSVLSALPLAHVERVALTDEAEHLRDLYLAARVVTPPHANDALHVALAVAARADMIVSWNFKHIVHYEKIRAYNAVNLLEGYSVIAIHSPQEVI